MASIQDVPSEILAWSKDRPAWQRDALRRLFSAGEFGQQELDELTRLCKAARGLAEPSSPKHLAREHLATKGVSAEAVSLVSLTHHKGANALAAEQTITFGPHLTILYGPNAAGKSGYARILKQACRSRFSEQILGNVLSGAIPARVQATIKFRQGAEESPAAWRIDSAPSDALATVSVFDSACAPVYLRDKTDVAFRPFGLDIFDRLAAVCGEVRSRIESEKARLNALTPNLPVIPEGTRARSTIDHLTSLTNSDVVRALATLSADEQARMEALRTHRRDVLAADPKQRARELVARAERIDVLVRHVADLFTIFRGSAVAQLRSTAITLRSAQEALSSLRKTALTPDLLPGTGEETWRKLWETAEEFSGVAYPESPYPVVTDGARCPFCQQEIGAEASERLRHFAEYVSSSAQAKVKEAEIAHRAAVGTVTKAVVRRAELEPAINETGEDNPPLRAKIEDYFLAAERTQKGVKEALATGVEFLATGLAQSPETDLKTAATGLRERARQLQAEKPAMSPQDTAELKEFEARTVLGEHLKVVLAEIERKKRLAAYDQCIADTSTKAITLKSTELTTRLVTDQLRTGFQEELHGLEFNDLEVEIQAAGGAKGALFHRLVFSNAPGVAMMHVLSEGESRTLSLAAFLTELKTAAGRSAIIFDDPVSSLDHIWRDRIARRLVDEARERQVIVFTHDIVFLRFLLDQAASGDIPFEHRHIQRGAEVGVCTDDLPWIAMGIAKRLGKLRNLWQDAEKLSRTAPERYETAVREIYRHLRDAWEQATAEVLMNDVVQRYRPSIETKKVKCLYDITAADCKAVEDGMTESSRWLHDQPPADGTPIPKPDAVKKRIDDLATFVDTVNQRRKKK